MREPRRTAPVTFDIARPVIDGIADWAFFVAGGVAAVWLAVRLVEQSFTLGWWQIAALVVFWLFLTYLVLPRLHRILTQIYVPNYFIGRARTSDGLLGDPVNLALLGEEEQVHEALAAAGWTRADDLSLRTAGRIIAATVMRRSYPAAPVSPLLLFGRKQDFAYQQEVDGTPGRRHHLRFWRCPDGWRLPGGHRADWLAAGTYDRSVGLSLFTFQITHKIDANTDIERDHIVATVRAATPAVGVEVIEDFSTGYHARNGGGDTIETDGALPVLDLRRVAARDELQAIHTDSRDRRPSAIAVGSGLVVIRAVVALLYAALLLVDPSVILDVELTIEGDSIDPRAAVIAVAAVFAAYGVIELALAFAVFRGSNAARVITMALSAAAIGAQILGFESTALSSAGSVPGLALDVLVVLSLSSERALTFTGRKRDARRVAAPTQVPTED